MYISGEGNSKHRSTLRERNGTSLSRLRSNPRYSNGLPLANEEQKSKSRNYCGLEKEDNTLWERAYLSIFQVRRDASGLLPSQRPHAVVHGVSDFGGRIRQKVQAAGFGTFRDAFEQRVTLRLRVDSERT